MTKHQYYRNGVEISEAEAIDHRGLLRDQTSMRVRTTMRDSPPPWARADTKDSVGFTDGSGDPWSASRPGFRVRANDDRRAVHDAYQVYATRLVNQYKLHDGEALCGTCNGSGVGDGGMCDDCMGEGVVDDGGYQRSPANTEVSHDSRRTIDAAGLARHRQLMDRLYAERDAETSNMWRNK